MTFTHPLIKGLMFQHQSDGGDAGFKSEAELTLDWYGGNAIKRFDEFLSSGYLHQWLWDGKLFWGGSFVLYHTKNEELLKDAYLLDRFYYQLFVGSDLNSLLPILDRFSFSIGTLSSLERKRHTQIDPFKHQIGWQFDAEIAYRGFGLANSLYWGDRQFAYFQQYGEELYAGLPFYQSKLYNRTELYYQYKNSYLTARAGVIFHFLEGRMAHQQRISITLDTDKLISWLR